MKVLISLILIFGIQICSGQSDKTRLIVLADMGNEPDEVQQMVHMIMYSNEFDIEGLIAVSGKYHSFHSSPTGKNQALSGSFSHDY